MSRIGTMMGTDQSFRVQMEDLENVKDLWRMMEFSMITNSLGYRD